MLFASACAWAIGADMLEVVSIATMMSARAGSPSRLSVLLTVVEVPATSVVVTGVGVSVSAAAAGIAPTSHRAVAANAAAKRMGVCLERTDPSPLRCVKHGHRPTVGRIRPRVRASARAPRDRPRPDQSGSGTGSLRSTGRHPRHPVAIAVEVAGVPVPVNRPLPRQGECPAGPRVCGPYLCSDTRAKRYPERPVRAVPRGSSDARRVPCLGSQDRPRGRLCSVVARPRSLSGLAGDPRNDSLRVDPVDAVAVRLGHEQVSCGVDRQACAAEL